MKVAASVLAILMFGVPVRIASSQTIVGQFAGNGDIGPVKHAGSATYDPQSQSYTVVGSGSNMWFDHDEFHFAWRRVKGDCILEAAAKLMDKGVEPHRKLGLMVRQSLEPNSPYVDIAVHGDGMTSLQFRRTADGQTEEIRAPIIGANVIQLQRRGNRFTMSAAWTNGPFASPRSVDVELGDEVYVGLFVCAHNADVSEVGRFHNVRVTIPADEDFVPYRDYIGSNLEILDVATGNRTVVFQSGEPLQAPIGRPTARHSSITHAAGCFDSTLRLAKRR